MPLLPSERTAFSEAGLASCGLAENGGAALADNYGLGVGEDGCDGEATRTLHVHEEGSRSRHERLELVLAGLRRRGRVEKIDGENHFVSLSLG